MKQSSLHLNDESVSNSPTPLRASPPAETTGCCDRSTWLVACPGRSEGLLVLSLRMETLWRRCTRAVLRSAPEWPKPAAYSRILSPADESEKTKGKVFLHLMRNVHPKQHLQTFKVPYQPRWRASSPVRWLIDPWRLGKAVQRSN